ncbi:MAG: SpoVA/SpoVAEb family sporulation membrane protein [Oscillospiraceae bacterium]|jgi:stage V sporulation protein AC|nr:SpoVA/SpoVAEb family sporulation membrane protein [Oscillospiraceae bacterium]
MSKITTEEYNEYVKQISPKSQLIPNMLKAFLGGGVICTVGQAVLEFWSARIPETEAAAAATSVSMILLGVLLTAFGLYDEMARFGKAGTLVPITGFANSIASPALEFKSEGFTAGTAAKMFVVGGPVIVFGLTASVVYGIIYVLLL